MLSYNTNIGDLNREMASLTSAVAMAIYHQAKPCRPLRVQEWYRLDVCHETKDTIFPYLADRRVSASQNVALCCAQSQHSIAVRPDFNEEMKAKWPSGRRYVGGLTDK